LPGVTRGRMSLYAVDCDANLMPACVPGLWQLLPEQYGTRIVV